MHTLFQHTLQSPEYADRERLRSQEAEWLHRTSRLLDIAIRQRRAQILRAVRCIRLEIVLVNIGS